MDTLFIIYLVLFILSLVGFLTLLVMKLFNKDKENKKEEVANETKN